MNKYYSLGTQILYIVFVSIISSIVFNQLRSDPLSYIKKQVKVVSDLENLQLNNTEPMITGIDINIAKKLFDKNVLFIDARDEESYNEGHIPNSLCNDDFDSLVVQLEKIIKIDEQFVVYCSDSDCGSSEDLSYELQTIGYNNILLFKGGWKEWVDADYKQDEHE